MKTIRHKVFETNSSTTHCITFENEKKVKSKSDIPRRDPKEFPELNENGELEVEMNIYWDDDVRNNELIDLHSADGVIKYITAHAVFSNIKTMYGRRNPETKDNFDANHIALLNDIQKAYKIMGLKPPVDVKPYTLDVNDKKIFITKDTNNKWILPVDTRWGENKKDWEKRLKKRIKENPEVAKYPHLKYNIGMCGNDLCGSSYESCLAHFSLEYIVTDWDYSGDSDGDMNIDTVDVLTHDIGLSFYHT